MKNTILEITTTRRNQPTRKHQYCSQSDGSGYWHLIYEWVDGSWQIVSRDPLDEIEIDISNSHDILPGVNAGVSSRWGYRLPAHGGNLRVRMLLVGN